MSGFVCAERADPTVIWVVNTTESLTIPADTVLVSVRTNYNKKGTTIWIFALPKNTDVY